MDTYFPSEFDLLLIFNHFDVPVLLRMNALQKMYLVISIELIILEKMKTIT